MKLDATQVRHVAKLARLAVSDREVETLRVELSAILDAVETLAELDTSSLHPVHLAEPGALRVDVAAEELSCDQALAAAPRREAGSFAIPKVIE